MPFTLDKLAKAMRGVPRDARILVQLPSGELVNIEAVAPTHLHDERAALGASSYGIVLVIEDSRG